MQTRALKTLVRISKAGSFAKAAEQLNMTLSAVSMQMKTLEEELGTDLFDRSVRPPRLTPVGRSVVRETILLLQCEDRLIDTCRPSDTLVGRFRIGFVTTAAVRLLPRFVEMTRQHTPNATFEFETGLSKALQSKVLSGQIDAAVVTDADGLPDGLSACVIQQEPFVYAAHETLLEDGLAGLLARQPFFHFMPDTGIGKLIASEMQACDRPENAPTIVLDNLESIMGCVTAALGFTLLPEPDVARYRSTSVQAIPAPSQLRRTLVLTTLRKGSLATQENTLAGLLRGVA